LHRLAKLVVIGLLILSTANSAFCRPDGKREYMDICAQCHGPTGTGEGRTLTEANPPDLTLLSRKNGGKFPFEHVYRIVDGREMTEAHRRAMPFWGKVFQKPGKENTPESDAEVKGRILPLVEYIGTLQKK
jgi:mono/diheme cytochrome c family protein